MDAPLVTSNPANTNVNEGGSASFSVTASGPAEGGPLSYQWRKNGSNINGATSATFTINGAQLSDAGSYDVVVSNSGGSVISAAATLVVNDTTPPVVTCPANITVNCAGQNGAPVSFSASATDNVDGSLTPTCNPPSGSNFARGTNTVICSATDAHGNTGNCSF